MCSRGDSYSLTRRGCELCQEGRFEEAIDALTMATRLEPSNLDAWYSQAGCLYSLGRFDEALCAYVEVLKLNPNDQEAKRMAILTEDESGRRNVELNAYLSAAECCDFAFEVQTGYNPYRPDTNVKLEGCIAFCNKALELEPSCTTAHGLKGRALRLLGRHGGAVPSASGRELEPVYFVVLKARRPPSEAEIHESLRHFTDTGAVDQPNGNARIGGWSDPKMPTKGADGAFMMRLGRELISRYPELAAYITIGQKTFHSTGLALNIVGKKFPMGYVKVVHLKLE